MLHIRGVGKTQNLEHDPEKRSLVIGTIMLKQDDEAHERAAIMIKRIWRGYTTPENADIYERLLDSVVFPGIEAKNIPGYRSIELLRRTAGDEVEFTTVMSFDTLDNVIAFQGDDYERAYVPDAARKILKRWDERSTHHELLQIRQYR
jgi:antibiotic biosynthesis monooxygenase (ABM) superfamily enzyme